MVLLDFSTIFNTNLIRTDMKKVFVMAFMALSVAAMAQSVTPLTIKVAEFKVDSLRALYMNQPIMYRASLDEVAQALAKNATEVKNAKVVLKVEQAHVKEMASSLKEAAKMTAALKKLYGKEESELKSMQKTVEKQQKTLTKHSELNEETRQSYVDFLEKQQKELGYFVREVAERQRTIADLETTVQNGQTMMQSYNQQVASKAAELSQIEALLKERQTSLKAEQKSAKTMQ
jgi:chromosome segregation ATPase